VARTGLYRRLLWQASSQYEADDIRQVLQRFGLDHDPVIHVAPNLPPKLALTQGLQRPEKRSGAARILFLSRIARMKNLSYALALLQNIKGEVIFDMYGPLEDETYWQECRQIIDTLPDNVQVSYRGAVTADQVQETLASYHAFLLPTLGENFGHVLLEALAAGCPVITSDRTPWRGLAERQAGWDLPLEHPEMFVAAIQQIVDMDQTAWNRWSEGARQVAHDFIHDPAILEANRQLFYKALAWKAQ
jgi:glycosyltransferase involved in cell wall biosynthesis